MQRKPIPVWDRDSNKIVGEWMDDHTRTCEARPGWSPTQWIQSLPIYDNLYSALQYTAHSARRIKPFIDKYHINMDEFEYAHYRSFGEFFIRRSPHGVRSFPSLQMKWVRSRKRAISHGKDQTRRSFSR